MKAQTQGRGLFGLISHLRKPKKKQLRILVLGLDNAGKTTILKALSNQDITTVTPTHGFNIKNVSKDNFNLTVWDIGGQKTLRDYWSNYVPNTDGLVYVVDSADTKRVQQAGYQLDTLLIQKDLSGVPLLIYANKQDLEIALNPQQILQKMEIEQMKTRQWTICACSAKSRQGIQDGLSWLFDNIKK